MPSADTPPVADTHVRRRARTHRQGLFSRSLFRYPGRRRHSTLAAFPASEQDPSSVPEDANLSSSLLHRHRHHHHHSARENQPKPIYIYPGLLRIVRDKAIALDNQCPAVLYKCRECRRDPKLHTPVPNNPALSPDDKDLPRSSDDPTTPPAPVVKCPHQVSCAICLEDFHSKDLVRKLPCNVNHVFHSKCILDWFVSQHRCPLCNGPVTNTVQARVTALQNETRRLPLQFHRGMGIPEGEDPAGEAQSTTSRQQPPTPTAQNSAPQPAARDQSRGQPSVPHRAHEAPDARQKPAASDKAKKKQRGPRTYSYIVHDNVRMEMNPVIPV